MVADTRIRLCSHVTMTENPPFRPIFVPPGTPPHEMPVDDVRPVLRVATVSRRLLGRLLDIGAVLASFSLIFGAAVLLPLMVTDRVPEALLIVLLVTMFSAVLVSFVILRIGLVAWWGCTAGQRIAGLRVVTYPDGTPARGWRPALRRWFIARGRSSLGPLDDLMTMLRDPKLRRCDHDERAGTVVVLAQAPLVPAVPGPGVTTMPPSLVPSDGRSWEAAERIPRIALGAALALAMLMAVALVTASVLDNKLVRSPAPAFAINTFYDDKPHFEVRSPTGRSGSFDRTSGKLLNSKGGCQAGAVDDRVRGLLRELGCQGQIEMAFTTSDGVVRASGHLLRFDDATAAARAAGRLRWTDLRFVPGGPIDPPGMVTGGLLDHQKRYVVVTSVVAPKGAGVPEEAKNALILLHVPTVNTILFR
jgi:hypothetical protein